MKISEFEKVSGLARDTLRYYEKIGILTPPSRGLNGYREYGQAQLEELAFIQKGKEIGFSLSVIKEGYRRYKNLGYFCPEFSEQLHKKRAQLSQRIADDKQAIAEIDKLLGKAGRITHRSR
ncbi:MAG: hypothetical protein B0W54_23435 [Cellvibrio sp. 79]|nr:MAG: hypothetical protein B0W54_23435 [Cellvibrio sp. 79]